MSLTFLCLFALVFTTYARISYYGQQVIQCYLSPELGPTFQDAMADHLVDVWGCTSDRYCTLRVRNAAEREAVELFFATTACQMVIPDLEVQMQQFDAEHDIAVRATQGAAFPDPNWFKAYHNYTDTQTWWRDLASYYNTLAGLEVTYLPTIGPGVKTYEGRNNTAITIKSAAGIHAPWIYFQCQIHAREWISGATCQWVINNLLSKYVAGDATARDIISQVNIAVVTVVNPDGYSETWTGDRMWRKNRRNNGGACIGVDLNRNYDDHWGQGGSSNVPCSDTYRGPSAASEPEVQNTAGFFRSLFATGPVYGGIDWHSYSQLVLRPYGWTTANSPDEKFLKKLGDDYAAAVKGVHGKVYTSEKSVELYITTGTASDWFYGPGSKGQPYNVVAAGFTVELRPDKSVPGFELPPDQIIATGEENYAGVITWIKSLIANPIKNGTMV